MKQQTLSIEEFQHLRGADVCSQEGEKIGSVEEVYVDYETQRPEWIGLGTGFFGTKRVLVPVEGATLGDDQITVPYARDHVKDAPDMDADEIDQESERALYAHYGLGYSERRSDSGLPEGGRAGEEDLADTMKDRAAMTRSEEELRVGKRDEEMGRLHLHKWVETEQVEVPVELKREKARVTREPVDGDASGEIGEESLDVTLREERPVVAKETVAKEKIGIEKEVEAERTTVGGEVRKERVEVEDDTARS
jgi:uncharacterized protein (TIGR02271 family)